MGIPDYYGSQRRTSATLYKLISASVVLRSLWKTLKGWYIIAVKDKFTTITYIGDISLNRFKNNVEKPQPAPKNRPLQPHVKLEIECSRIVSKEEKQTDDVQFATSSLQFTSCIGTFVRLRRGTHIISAYHTQTLNLKELSYFDSCVQFVKNQRLSCAKSHQLRRAYNQLVVSS